MSKHVAVLMGGWSAEREISLALRQGLRARRWRGSGYRVTRIDVGRDIAAVLATVKPDVALNVLHGRPGEDGTMQGILEILAIPYTHSGVLASAVAMQKDRAKIVIPRRRGAGSRGGGGIAVGGGQGPRAAAPLCHQAPGRGLERRRFHRHARTTRIRRRSSPATDWHYGERVMVEHYIPGKELTCAVMGDEALGVIEIVPTHASTTTRRNTPPAAPTHLLPRQNFIICLPTGPKTGAGGASRAGLPGREPCGFPLRRSHRGDGGTCLSRGQHPARHDRDVAGARTRGACGHHVRRAGEMDGRGRLAQPLKWIAALRLRLPAGAAARGVADAKTARPKSRVARIMDRWSSLLESKWPRGAGIAASGLDHSSRASPTAPSKGITSRASWPASRTRAMRSPMRRLAGHVGRARRQSARQPRGSARGRRHHRRHLARYFLTSMRYAQRLKGNPWIADATVLKLYPGELQIGIKEREPFALWQKDGRVSVIAEDGTVLEPYVDAAHGPACRLSSAVARQTKAKEFLALLDRYPAMRDFVRACVLVGERRWNLRLKNGIDVRLPESDIAPRAGAVGRARPRKEPDHARHRRDRSQARRPRDGSTFGCGRAGSHRGAQGQGEKEGRRRMSAPPLRPHPENEAAAGASARCWSPRSTSAPARSPA